MSIIKRLTTSLLSSYLRRHLSKLLSVHFSFPLSSKLIVTSSIKNDSQYRGIEIVSLSALTVVHVVEKITTLGSAKTTVIEIQPRNKSSDKSSQLSRSETPNETPGKVQRKRKVKASEDKAIKEKIPKAETVSRNERQKKEPTHLNTVRIFPFAIIFFLLLFYI